MSSKTPRARVQPTKSCHDLAGYYGFKDLQKTSLNHLLRDLAMTLKAKYDLKSIFENGYKAKYTYLSRTETIDPKFIHYYG